MAKQAEDGRMSFLAFFFLELVSRENPKHEARQFKSYLALVQAKQCNFHASGRVGSPFDTFFGLFVSRRIGVLTRKPDRLARGPGPAAGFRDVPRLFWAFFFASNGDGTVVEKSRWHQTTHIGVCAIYSYSQSTI